MAKKISPKKAVSKKTAVKSTPKKKESRSVKSVTKAKPSAKNKATFVKKSSTNNVAKKPIAKSAPAKKPAPKSSPKKNDKSSSKSKSDMGGKKASSSSKPIKKTQVKTTPKKNAPPAKPQPKKSTIPAKKPVVSTKKDSSKKTTAADKKAKLEKERRAEINAKAEPKKSTLPKSSKTPSKKDSRLPVSEPMSKKDSDKKPPKSPVKEVSEPEREIQIEKHPTVEPRVTNRGGKFRVRPSHNIYFSIEDLDAYLSRREVSQASAQVEKKSNKIKQVAPQQTAQKRPVAVPVPRPPLAVATVFDILGISPASPKVSREKLDEQDVPRKWKKYYKLLVDLREHHSSGVETRAEEVMKRSAKDDAGDLSSYGQHLADAGSESFERDMAYNIISNQKEILSEIDEAIKRIKNGTYGICEVTGLPIPESRLTSIPYTRCTKEGQEIKETEIKRQKANRRTSMYDISDGSQTTSPSDEDSASE